MTLWSVLACVLVLSVIENVKSIQKTQKDLAKMDEDLDGAYMDRKYIALYNEMMKSNQDTVEKLAEDDAFGLGTDLRRLKGIADRRRSSRMSSPVKNRRVRSQALRREKLNNQSLRSHREHSRQSSFERTNKN